MIKMLESFSWGEPVMFHALHKDGNVLCVTFLRDAEEICMDGSKVHVKIHHDASMPDAPEILYDIARLRYFVEYVVKERKRMHPSINTLPSQKIIGQYFADLIKKAL